MSGGPGGARFAQVGYTSGRTGFGIHAEVGDPTDAERDLLVRGADPERTDFGQELPRFAAPEAKALFNRNLVSAPVAPGATATWHTAPAGADESGRTGNVFVHAVLDRAAGTGGHRAIDAWRSPDWVTPYGVGEVRVSVLPTAAPGPGAVVGRREICDFLLDPSTWRLGVLSRLLDELALPRGERGPIVLGVASPDVGALWVGAVTHLMSPGSAAGLGFGVWETTRALQPERISRCEFLCMPEREVAAVRERFPQVRTLLESDDAAPRDWTADDTRADLAWGALAVGMFSLAEDPAAVLDELDALADRVGDHDLARFWPLAMAMARRLDAWDFLSHPIAAALRAGSPATLASQPDLLDATIDLVGRHTGETAADAWAALEVCAPGPISAVLQRIYLGRAVRDAAWLVQRGGPPARRDASGEVAEHPGLAADVADAVERTGAIDDPVSRAVTLVNLADLLVRAGWPTADPDAFGGGALIPAIARQVRPVLSDPEQRLVFTSATNPGGATRRDVIRVALADWPGDIAAETHLPVGRRIPEAVLAWLYPSDPTTDPLRDPSLLDLEALALAATAAAGDTRDRARQRLLDAAIGSIGPEDGDTRRQLLAVVAESRTMRSAEVRRVLQAGLRPTDTQVAAAVLIAEADEAADALGLIGEVAVARERPAVDAPLRTLSLLVDRPGWGSPNLDIVVARYARAVLDAFTTLWALARLPAGSLWAGHLAAAIELADVRTDERGLWGAVLPPPETIVPGGAELFASLLRLPLTDPRTWESLDTIALRAMACAPGSPKPPPPASPPMRAHALRDVDGSPALAAGLAGFYAGLSKEQVASVRDGLLALTERLYGEGSDVADFARGWFARISGSRGVGDRLRQAGGRFFGRPTPGPQA